MSHSENLAQYKAQYATTIDGIFVDHRVAEAYVRNQKGYSIVMGEDSFMHPATGGMAKIQPGSRGILVSFYMC